MGRHFIGLHEAMRYQGRELELMGQFVDLEELILPHECVEQCDAEALGFALANPELGLMALRDIARERLRDDSGITRRRVTDLEAEGPAEQVLDAPLLELPTIRSENQLGRVLDVARVGCLPSGASPVFWIETVDEKRYRLPSGLSGWASDTIEFTLALKLLQFPCRFEFGVLNGGAYTELLAEGVDRGGHQPA